MLDPRFDGNDGVADPEKPRRFSIRPNLAVILRPRFPNARATAAPHSGGACREEDHYQGVAPTAMQRSDGELGAVIEAIFREHRGRYGYRRIGKDLAARDMTCAFERSRRIMKERGLKAFSPKASRLKPVMGGPNAPRSISS